MAKKKSRKKKTRPSKRRSLVRILQPITNCAPLWTFRIDDGPIQISPYLRFEIGGVWKSETSRRFTGKEDKLEEWRKKNCRKEDD